MIRWDGRLEVDAPSIPLAEMLLEKMQIVQINEKDIIDTIMLLLEHPLGEHRSGDHQHQARGRAVREDWGLWRTTTMNLNKVRILAQGYEQLTPRSRRPRRGNRWTQPLARIEKEPKSMAWRLRARVGDRVKWYKDVDEVE